MYQFLLICTNMYWHVLHIDEHWSVSIGIDLSQSVSTCIDMCRYVSMNGRQILIGTIKYHRYADDLKVAGCSYCCFYKGLRLERCKHRCFATFWNTMDANLIVFLMDLMSVNANSIVFTMIFETSWVHHRSISDLRSKSPLQRWASAPLTTSRGSV